MPDFLSEQCVTYTMHDTLKTEKSKRKMTTHISLSSNVSFENKVK